MSKRFGRFRDGNVGPAQQEECVGRKCRDPKALGGDPLPSAWDVMPTDDFRYRPTSSESYHGESIRDDI